MTYRLNYRRGSFIQKEDFSTLVAAIARCHALLDDDATYDHEIVDDVGHPLLLSTELGRLRLVRQRHS